MKNKRKEEREQKEPLAPAEAVTFPGEAEPFSKVNIPPADMIKGARDWSIENKK